MPLSDPKTYLWANLCALMGTESPSIDAVKAKTKVGRGTIQRIKAGETSVGINILVDIAKAFDLEPWQLLIPDLDPDQLPRLEGQTIRWPFRVPLETLSRLHGVEASAVEAGLAAAMAAAGISTRPPSTKRRSA